MKKTSKVTKIFSCPIPYVCGIMVALGVILIWTGLSAKSNDDYNAEIMDFVNPSAPEVDNSGIKRVIIKPFNEQFNGELRNRNDVDVQHEFEGKFTANVPVTSIPELEQFADVEEVVKLSLLTLDNPNQQEVYVCGDGVVHPSEQCGEPGLSSCSGNKVCYFCKCVNPNMPGTEARTCFPRAQKAYNVTQVNGGQITAGSGINVAVLDTGAYTQHKDLDIKVCKDATQKGMREGCEDTIGHGTHVAGIVSANGGGDQKGIYGVAPQVNLWAIKVCYSTNCNDDDIAEGINYAAKRGANIISMSFGDPNEAPLIKEAIDKYPDVLFIAAAGNSGSQPNTIQYPAAYPNVVAVAAIDSNKRVASYSSRGINDGNDSIISAREIELAAGGSSVESTYYNINYNGCYVRMSGTSMAAPTVSGLAAKVWQGSADATRMYLRQIAQDITTASGGGAGVGYDIASGYGLPVAP